MRATSRLLRLTLLASGAGAGLLGAALASQACLRIDSYVYSAQKYDPAADCLAAYAPVEVVNGSGAGAACPTTCLAVGADLYVTAMCPPLPAIATAVPDDAGACIAALAAAAREAGTCTPSFAGPAVDADASDDATAPAPPADAATGG